MTVTFVNIFLSLPCFHRNCGGEGGKDNHQQGDEKEWGNFVSLHSFTTLCFSLTEILHLQRVLRSWVGNVQGSDHIAVIEGLYSGIYDGK